MSIKNNLNNYYVYTGKKLREDIFILLLLDLFFILFIRFDFSGMRFSEKRNSIIYTLLGVSQILPFMQHINEFFNLGKTECYLKTFSKSFETYKSWYLINFIEKIIEYVVVVLIVYGIGLQMGTLPSNALFLFLADIFGGLVIFGITPFFFRSKSQKIISFKMWLGLLFALVMMVLNNLFSQYIFVIWLVAFIPLMIFSNRRWLGIMKVAYSDGGEK